jgi:hypothetical protein
VLRGGDGDDTLAAGPGINTLVEKGDVDVTLTELGLTGLGSDKLVRALSRSSG